MKEINNYPDNFGTSYSYLLDCRANWRKATYRTWWLTRTYLEVVRSLNLLPGSTVLSVGAGMGQMEHFLVKPFNYQVASVDFNLPSLQAGQTIFKDSFNPVYATALHLPFPDQSFDAVISFDFMEHLPSEEYAQSALTEMNRVMKIGGKMFHKITVIGEEGIDQDPTHYIKKTPEEWKHWFLNRNFITVKPTDYQIPIWSRNKIGFFPVKGAFHLKNTN